MRPLLLSTEITRCGCDQFCIGTIDDDSREHMLWLSRQSESGKNGKKQIELVEIGSERFLWLEKEE